MQLSLFNYEKPVPKNVSTQKLRANVLRVYRSAHGLEKWHGKCWYRRANAKCAELAVKYNVSTECVAYVVAALSPNSEWRKNVEDATALLHEVCVRGIGWRYRTYKPNVVKARAIVETYRSTDAHVRSNWRDVLKGNKVNAFARNLAFPDTSSEVTIDFHALSVAHGYRYTAKTCPAISDTLYLKVSRVYCNAARELNLLPQEFQACVWLVWKRMHRV